MERGLDPASNFENRPGKYHNKGPCNRAVVSDSGRRGVPAGLLVVVGGEMEAMGFVSGRAASLPSVAYGAN